MIQEKEAKAIRLLRNIRREKLNAGGHIEPMLSETNDIQINLLV